MSIKRCLCLAVTVVAVAAAWTIGRPTPAASQDGIEVFFSPKGGCTLVIIDMIERAQDSIRVQAYSFTSAPIAKAILEAHKTGVEVTVVLDSSQRTAQYSSATFFHNQGIPVLIDSKHAIAHNKIILIDDSAIITGSFNFSKAAEQRNAENLLVIENKAALMKAYRSNFDQHLKHSEPYDGLDRDPPKEQSPDDDAATATVYTTRTGTKYHRSGCRYLSKSKSPLALKDAKRRGLTPCKVCKSIPKEPQQRAVPVTTKQRAAMKTVRESVVRVLGGEVAFDSEQATPSPDDDYIYYVTGTAISHQVRKRYKATVYYYDGAFVLGVLSRPDGKAFR